MHKQVLINMQKQLAAILTVVIICWSIVSYAAVNDEELKLVIAAKQQKWDVVSTLVVNGGYDINQYQADGATTLAWSVYWDNADITRLLLDSGADTNIANVYGVTPLFLATNNRNPAIARMLLEAGADANARLWSGVTPVMNVSKDGVNELLSLLIEQGAYINSAEPLRGQTALMWA
jgi:ankyrin repeat protein